MTCCLYVCVCGKRNAYTHDEHVAFSGSPHALIPNLGDLQVSPTSEIWRAWRALKSLLKVVEDIRTALELFGQPPTFPRGFNPFRVTVHLLRLDTEIQCISTIVEIATNKLSQHFCFSTNFQNLWLTGKLLSCSSSSTYVQSIQHLKDALVSPTVSLPTASLASRPRSTISFGLGLILNVELRFKLHQARKIQAIQMMYSYVMLTFKSP